MKNEDHKEKRNVTHIWVITEIYNFLDGEILMNEMNMVGYVPGFLIEN